MTFESFAPGQLSGSDLPSSTFLEMVAKWCLTLGFRSLEVEGPRVFSCRILDASHYLLPMSCGTLSRLEGFGFRGKGSKFCFSG